GNGGQSLSLHRVHEVGGSDPGCCRSDDRRSDEVTETLAIGQRLDRADGRDKVTGHATYVADVKLPGMLHAKLLRSPHAHARILSINVERARALAGVRCVLTAKDLDRLEREPSSRAM